MVVLVDGRDELFTLLLRNLLSLFCAVVTLEDKFVEQFSGDIFGDFC